MYKVEIKKDDKIIGYISYHTAYVTMQDAYRKFGECDYIKIEAIKEKKLVKEKKDK